MLYIAGAALLALMLQQLWYLGQVLRLQHHNPDQSAYMERAQAQGKVHQYWRDYDQISDHLKRAVLISEDAHFTQHWGFDWEGIRYALNRNLEAGKPVAGGSTITQQLAKNLFLSGKRSYVRKAQEAAIALMLELSLSKQRILELYLNMAQWGHQIYGAEAASRHYFKVSAAQLSPAQAAQLAAMLPRPNYYDFRGPTDYVEQRASWIERQLALVEIPNPTGPPPPPYQPPVTAEQAENSSDAEQSATETSPPPADGQAALGEHDHGGPEQTQGLTE
ncbi:peptidoglycantransglycosylase [Alcanivorax hongdengensis A-11-3]|uniref:Biosynthetic peptidoglycan transglycosylase n=1 Tax=Alcanivorax hongdengensis A-11-3 TaxID=1177179 RepID=L0WHV2_9GAMM|nr:peptidoglycantransglycosylase [Alcanivorax hongdengensis A-11-3]